MRRLTTVAVLALALLIGAVLLADFEPFAPPAVGRTIAAAVQIRSFDLPLDQLEVAGTRLMRVDYPRTIGWSEIEATATVPLSSQRQWVAPAPGSLQAQYVTDPGVATLYEYWTNPQPWTQQVPIALVRARIDPEIWGDIVADGTVRVIWAYCPNQRCADLCTDLSVDLSGYGQDDDVSNAWPVLRTSLRARMGQYADSPTQQQIDDWQAMVDGWFAEDGATKRLDLAQRIRQWNGAAL